MSERKEAVPVRIQLSRQKGWRMPANTVKVDRSSIFGNPFPVHKATATKAGRPVETWIAGTWDGPGMWVRDTEAEAIEIAVDAFRAWITHPAQSSLLSKAEFALRGKNLACWCKPGAPCHADVLLDLANRPLPHDKEAEGNSGESGHE